MKKILKPGIHWLFIFIPIALILDFNHASAPLIFFAAALSIIPIAKLIGNSTEQLATYTGDSVGGLLNATFGNAPELIIAVIALKAGLHEMVLASLAGAILANLLLAMGASFLFGGIKFHNQNYNPASVRSYSSMMLIAVISLTIPGAFHRLTANLEIVENENSLNIYLAIVLLFCYACYLVFMLKTHPDFFKSTSPDNEEEHEEKWSMQRAIITLGAASIAAAFMSEILVGAAEETGKVLGMTSLFIGVVFLAVIGGAAESISAVSLAMKNKMDLSIGIAMGSSIQIALFVAPVLVLMSTFVGPMQFNLNFSKGLVTVMFLSVILGTLVAGDGSSNWFKGVQLVLVYFIIGMLLFFVPA